MRNGRAAAWDSVFTFRIDKRIKATARNDEMVLISDIPVKRRVKVEVRLDDKPYETLWVDLQREPDHRICLWLYTGYWHWVDMGWEAKLGCKCEVRPVTVKQTAELRQKAINSGPR